MLGLPGQFIPSQAAATQAQAKADAAVSQTAEQGQAVTALKTEVTDIEANSTNVALTIQESQKTARSERDGIVRLNIRRTFPEEIAHAAQFIVEKRPPGDDPLFGPREVKIVVGERPEINALVASAWQFDRRVNATRVVHDVGRASAFNDSSGTMFTTYQAEFGMREYAATYRCSCPPSNVKNPDLELSAAACLIWLASACAANQ